MNKSTRSIEPCKRETESIPQTYFSICNSKQTKSRVLVLYINNNVFIEYREIGYDWFSVCRGSKVSFWRFKSSWFEVLKLVKSRELADKIKFIYRGCNFVVNLARTMRRTRTVY